MDCRLLQQIFLFHIFEFKKSAMSILNFNLQENYYEYNKKQLEVLQKLNDVVTKISEHFQQDDSFSSKSKLEFPLLTSKRWRKRGKAIVNFEKHFKRELGFKKDDIITILNQADDDCWIGELNGVEGWFPAKFVEVLDERTKFYSKLGDGATSPVINELIRENLCNVLLEILFDGLKTSFVSKPHPWYFIEESSFAKVGNKFDYIYSRLVLCKSFSLEETNTILTPEELLYRSIHAVNDKEHHASLDSKFTSLICYGLNQQVLHYWLRIWCCSLEIKKWYQPWALLRSDKWSEIECVFNVLSRYSFSLKPNVGLGENDGDVIVRTGLRDILAKYYLFSWDI